MSVTQNITSKNLNKFFTRRLTRNEDKIRELTERIIIERLDGSGNLEDLNKEKLRKILSEAQNKVINKLYEVDISKHVSVQDLSKGTRDEIREFKRSGSLTSINSGEKKETAAAVGGALPVAFGGSLLPNFVQDVFGNTKEISAASVNEILNMSPNTLLLACILGVLVYQNSQTVRSKVDGLAQKIK